jgi:hypothetical protein
LRQQQSYLPLKFPVTWERSLSVLIQWYQFEVYPITKSKPSERKCKNDSEIHIEGHLRILQYCSACRHCRYIPHLKPFQKWFPQSPKVRYKAMSVHPYHRHFHCGARNGWDRPFCWKFF